MARKQPRCPKCGFDGPFDIYDCVSCEEGPVQLHCPDCGHVWWPDKEKQRRGPSRSCNLLRCLCLTCTRFKDDCFPCEDPCNLPNIIYPTRRCEGYRPRRELKVNTSLEAWMDEKRPVRMYLAILFLLILRVVVPW